MNSAENIILPETEFERKIIGSEAFLSGTAFQSKGKSHPERSVYTHILQILKFIDMMPWVEYRKDLRIIALLHDLGKHRVVYDENRNIVGNSHSMHAEEIAREFLEDSRLLYIIRIHDRHYGFYKSYTGGKFDEKKFLETFKPADLELLTRFNYADSNSRDKSPVIWFEDTCVNLGLKKEKIYIDQPDVLKYLTAQ